MASLTVATPTRLGLLAQEAEHGRTQARRNAPLRRWSRRVTRGFLGTMVAVFAVLGFGAGTAQAWPWDVGENVTAFITNFCGPENVPVPSNHIGADSTFGLNNPTEATDKRVTILPNMDDRVAGASAPGEARLQMAYEGQDLVIHPTYERYGFDTLRWSNYGSGCFSVGHWFNGVTNTLFNLFVKVPMMLGMAVLNWALGNVLYDTFVAVLSPMIAVFSAIFEPWIYIIAPIGVLWVWIKSKGSVQAVTKAGVWVLAICGTFLWMSNNTSYIVTTANNFVTEFAGGAAATLYQTATGGTTQPGEGAQTVGLESINQSLWYGVPYQTWALGQVGEEQAAKDRLLEQRNRVGWSAALLNGNYVAADADGKSVVANVNYWNALSYSPNGEGTKTHAWTHSSEETAHIWAKVPFLANVKMMCNDTETGVSEGSSDADRNRWMYGGSCDSAGAETAHIVPYFQGEAYNQQMIAAWSGAYASLAVAGTVGIASMYLLFQKMLFFFLLVFGPIFLAISTFADEKRRRFATTYFQRLLSNVIKQCVAVCAVLFVSYTYSTLLFPPPTLNMPQIPWIIKPLAAVLFTIALVSFAWPMKSILSAAAKGDANIVNKVADAPVTAAKTGAKVAVAAGVVAATGGFAAAGMAGAGGAGAAAKGAATGLGQVARLSGRGGVGRALSVASRGLNSIGDAQSVKQGNKAAERAGIMALANGPQGGKYERDNDGNLTARGRAAAAKDYQAMLKDGSNSETAAKVADSRMAQMFAGYRAQTGAYHPADPNSPENRRATAVKEGMERQQVSEDIKSRLAAERNKIGQTARDSISGPSFGAGAGFAADVALTGDNVLSEIGKTQADIVKDPATLLTSSAYNGGDVTTMDPRHPATAALTNLRFASVHGTDTQKQEALQAASAAIEQHGVPSQINAVRSVGETAAAFQGISVIGAMPQVTDAMSWQDRAQAATSVQAAIAHMPQGHPAGEIGQAYVSALANPGTDAASVTTLGNQFAEAMDVASADLTPDAARVYNEYLVAQASGADDFTTRALGKRAAVAILKSPEPVGDFVDQGYAQSLRSWATAAAHDAGENLEQYSADGTLDLHTQVPVAAPVGADRSTESSGPAFAAPAPAPARQVRPFQEVQDEWEANMRSGREPSASLMDEYRSAEHEWAVETLRNPQVSEAEAGHARGILEDVHGVAPEQVDDYLARSAAPSAPRAPEPPMEGPSFGDGGWDAPAEPVSAPQHDGPSFGEPLIYERPAAPAPAPERVDGPSFAAPPAEAPVVEQAPVADYPAGPVDVTGPTVADRIAGAVAGAAVSPEPRVEQGPVAEPVQQDRGEYRLPESSPRQRVEAQVDRQALREAVEAMRRDESERRQRPGATEQAGLVRPQDGATAGTPATGEAAADQQPKPAADPLPGAEREGERRAFRPRKRKNGPRFAGDDNEEGKA